MKKRRLIVGVSGATGIPLTEALLRRLAEISEVETHLILTEAARHVVRQEGNCSLEELCSLADVAYENRNLGAGPASGTFAVAGMVVVPCSMKTVAGIVCGYSDNLLLRAADVMLKERRKLILVARECPLGTVHLKNLLEVSRLGAVVLPPMLSYYQHPETVEDCTNHVVGKILRQLGIDAGYFYEWEGMEWSE